MSCKQSWGLFQEGLLCFLSPIPNLKKNFEQKPQLGHTTMPESQHPSTGCFSGSTPIDLTTIDELETGNAQPENDSKGNQSDAEDWDEGDHLFWDPSKCLLVQG